MMKRFLALALVATLAACGSSNQAAIEKPVTLSLEMIAPTDPAATTLIAHTPAGAVISPYQDSDDTMGIGQALIRTHSVELKYGLNWGNRYYTRLVVPKNSNVISKCDSLNYGSNCDVVVGSMSLSNRGTTRIQRGPFTIDAPTFDCTMTLSLLGSSLHLASPNTLTLGQWTHAGDDEHVFVAGKHYRCILNPSDNGGVEYPD